MENQTLTIANRIFRSRLMLGTGKFASGELMRDALAATGCEIVTVALRRAELTGKKVPFANILEFIPQDRYLLLPNTSGAMNAEEAVRLARLAVAAGGARLGVAAVVGPGVGSDLWAARGAGAQPVSSEATTAPAPMPASRRLSREF